ncbi:MAG TPA: CsgG/HfaB family protein [Phycisphaerae bacterium]|jgi:hypothetical protein|nr:hypothetical protein [Phycisphaerae bacterium]HOB73544.1 CsgG/HfaB family protein [Phycisphaerae bacterium]HOJ54152.1 CsgG/HfaB family protein [Phycisphaerae bacterium]HOL25555.1 CsgG/HfaB family protein [Phycisphaerae bacterium]HPP21012.1 CsgG/HfaB family protein [Phycisphaerae bacterium]
MSRLCWAVPIIIGVAFLGWAGCSQDTCESEIAPPPPPPPRDTAALTYDYTHSIQPKRRPGLRRKLVLALVRFAEDKPLDDAEVPFGPETSDTPAAGSTNISVNIQTSGVQAGKPTRQPLGINARAREILKHELMKTGDFVVVERERILDILREQKFSQSRHVNPATRTESGELMGVQYLLEGSIGLNEDMTFKNTTDAPRSYKDGDSPLYDRIFSPSPSDRQRRLRALAARQRDMMKRHQKQVENAVGAYLSLYDVRTGQLVAEAFGIGGNGLAAIQDAVEDLVDKCRNIPNPVCVAAIHGERIFLDIGSEDRVQPGQKFRYVIPGKEIRNSTGQIIGTADEEGGEFEVVQVEPLMCIAKVTRQVAAPVVGARVEPIE